MQKLTYFIVLGLFYILTACNSTPQNETTTAGVGNATESVGQSGVKDDVSTPNVVQVAVGSKDHTTLFTAVKEAALVYVLSAFFRVFSVPQRACITTLRAILASLRDVCVFFF